MKQSEHTLVIDVGGTNVKILATGIEERIKIPSGPEMTAEEMVRSVKKEAEGWGYERVSIAYPGPVVDGKIVAEPHNLAAGWLGFDFAEAFGCPVRILNDAAMQALGSYKGGTMLFLGLGTGLGAALIKEGIVVPLEIAHLPYKKGRSYEEYWGKAGYERMGEEKWQKHVKKIIALLRDAFVASEVVLGGGNADLIDDLPEYVRLGSNANAFTGGFRVWEGCNGASGLGNS